MNKCVRVLLFSFLFPISYLFGQEIDITNVKLVGDAVEVHYNLVDERVDRSYSINLYTSSDNFIQPMTSVSGDVGIDIPVGENKVLIWDAKKDLGDSFNGSVALEVKGNYYVPFITIEGFQKGQEFKRTKHQEIVWSGGRGDNILNFELYRGENLVKTFEERPNNGNTKLTFPRGIKPGGDYRLKISDTKNRDEAVFTDTFVIKRKYPLGAQLGVVFILGAGVGYLIKSLVPKDEPDIVAPPPLPNR